MAAKPAVDLLVPGTLETLTGGYLYDRRMLDGLVQLGWQTRTHSLDPSFPRPTRSALAHAHELIGVIPDDRLVLIDGLALTGLGPLLTGLTGRLKAIALIHHPLADETGLPPARAAELGAAERAALAVVPRVIVTSPWTRRRLADYAVDAERIAVVEPGVDPETLRVRPPSASVRLLCVASVTPRKGHAALIEALAALGRTDWTLRCVGSLERDPACAERLREQIAGSGLGARVVLLGELSPAQVHREYAAADLFVLASYLEGYGMVLTEAIAHGLPVISTTAGAIPETVPAAAGRLVPPGDVPSLAAALERLIADRAALATLQAAAREAARNARSWDRAARQLADVLTGYSGS